MSSKHLITALFLTPFSDPQEHTLRVHIFLCSWFLVIRHCCEYFWSIIKSLKHPTVLYDGPHCYHCGKMKKWTCQKLRGLVSGAHNGPAFAFCPICLCDSVSGFFCFFPTYHNYHHMNYRCLNPPELCGVHPIP